MSNKEAKSLADIASSTDTGLGRLAAAAQQRTELGEHLRKRLDPSLAAGFVHCNIRDDSTLVVIAASPEWAARLRFESSQLLAICREHGVNLSSVKVRVAT